MLGLLLFPDLLEPDPLLELELPLLERDDLDPELRERDLELSEPELLPEELPELDLLLDLLELEKGKETTSEKENNTSIERTPQHIQSIKGEHTQQSFPS